MDYFDYFNDHPSSALIVAELPKNSDESDHGDIVLFV